VVDRFLEGGFACFFEGVEGAAFEGGVGFDRVEDFIAEFAFAGGGAGVVVVGVLVDEDFDVLGGLPCSFLTLSKPLLQDGVVHRGWAGFTNA
jgi:hypothetical protein